MTSAIVYKQLQFHTAHRIVRTQQDAVWWQDYLRQSHEQYRLFSFWLGADVEGE